MVPTCAAIGLTLAAVLAASKVEVSKLEDKTAMLLEDQENGRFVSLRRVSMREAWAMMVFRLENGQVVVACREVLSVHDETEDPVMPHTAY